MLASESWLVKAIPARATVVIYHYLSLTELTARLSLLFLDDFLVLEELNLLLFPHIELSLF